MAAARIRSLLMAWYRLYRRDHPGANITVLCDLTSGMIGKSSDPALKTKAAETKYLLYYVNDALVEYSSALGPVLHAKLQGGGKALADYIHIMARHGRKLPDSAVQDIASMWGGVCVGGGHVQNKPQPELCHRRSRHMFHMCFVG